MALAKAQDAAYSPSNEAVHEETNPSPMKQVYSDHYEQRSWKNLPGVRNGGMVEDEHRVP